MLYLSAVKQRFYRTVLNGRSSVYLLVLCALPSAAALAQKYRYPLDDTVGEFGYYFDRDPGSGWSDWGCTSNSYNGHAGNDFKAPDGSPIYAAAQGIVIKAFYRSTGYGNRVVIQHPDGKYTLYAHMKNGSIMVNQGDPVQCGQQVGRVGNSGNTEQGTTHLHFGVLLSENEDKLPPDAIDPFRVTYFDCARNNSYCSNRACFSEVQVSLWIDQGDYGSGAKNHRRPSTQCDPGQVIRGDGPMVDMRLKFDLGADATSPFDSISRQDSAPLPPNIANGGCGIIDFKSEAANNMGVYLLGFLFFIFRQTDLKKRK